VLVIEGETLHIAFLIV